MLTTNLLSDWPRERWQDRKLLLGVSGGADSVALLLAMHSTADPGQLVVAHLNHGWRGAESDADQQFVTELCAQLNRPCIHHALQYRDNAAASQNDLTASREDAMLAKDNGSSGDMDISEREDAIHAFLEEDLTSQWKTEERARSARYEFFKQAAYSVGASYVITAHTADDRVETLLHNMLRGTGLAGAASLVMFRAFDQDLVLARPLLRKRRSQIEAFLAERGQTFREDSSNLLTHYRRNFLRRQVLPGLLDKYPAAVSNLLNFSELVEQHLDDLEQMAAEWLDSVQANLDTAGSAPLSSPAQRNASNNFIAPLTLIRDQPWSVVQAALRQVWRARNWPQGDMSRAQWQSIRDLCTDCSGAIHLPGRLRAEVVRSPSGHESRAGWLVIGPETRRPGEILGNKS